MNRMQSPALLAAVAALATVMVSDVMAQATRLRSETARAQPAGGAAASGVIRIREFTGFGPRALLKMPNIFPTGRTPARDWNEIRVVFDSEPEWIDELSFQYYALLHDKVTGEFSFLKGMVTHVDIERGKNHLCSAYIRPNTLARLGDVVAVAVEVLSKGESIATQSEGRLPRNQALPADWWKNAKLVPKEGLILNKSQTPFEYVNYDDYEALK